MPKYFFHLLLAACLVSLTSCGQQEFTGTFSNGFKGAKLSFVLSDDKKFIKDFIFRGHWRCGSHIELMTAGPEKPIPVKDGSFDVIIREPENGGSTAFRFLIKGTIKGKTASGTFRMNIVALGCDTYPLNWTAKVK